jgi:putative adenylate-forming enzyme
MLVRILTAQRRLRRNEAMSREELTAHQARALAKLRAHAYRKSPFYARHHRGVCDRPLAELPTLTKAQLMENFDQLVTDRGVRRSDVQGHVASLQGNERFLDKYWVSSTSGSTGLRGLFLSDRREWITVIASYARAMAWAETPASLLQRPRIGVVSSRVPWHQSARVGATVETRIAPVVRLDATDPLDRIVAELNAFEPQVLVAYASMLRVLATEQAAGRLHITPSAVMSASEVLTTEMKQNVADAFGTRPFDVYAATETAGIASECTKHSGMHLYEDLVITEVVDGDNRQVPIGTFGDKVLVTVLFSRTQPLIRYEMSDCVRLTERVCGCGRSFRMIDAVEGRTEEVLELPGADGGTIRVHPNVFHAVLEPIAVRGWQIVQEKDRLRVRLVAVDDAGAARAQAALRAALIEQDVYDPSLVIERIDGIPRSAIGKAPLIRRSDPGLAGTLSSH